VDQFYDPLSRLFRIFQSRRPGRPETPPGLKEDTHAGAKAAVQGGHSRSAGAR
jgi:hypothetical protein